MGITVLKHRGTRLKETGGFHRAHGAEICSWRDDVDMLVEDGRKAVGRGANDIIIGLAMTVNPILRVQHARCLINRDPERDGGATVLSLDGGRGVNAVGREPFIDKGYRVGVGCNKRIDLLLRQMLTVPSSNTPQVSTCARHK